MLCDTDILIDYLRNKDASVEYVEQHLDSIFVSAISIAELYQGVRDGEEQLVLDRFVSVFPVLPLTEEIAVKAGYFRRQFKKSHGTGLADCIIAATAQIHELELKTLNLKHFPMFPEIIRPY